MVVEESTCNGDGTECAETVQCAKREAVANGFAYGIGNDVAEGNSGESLRTYKRRRHAKLSPENKGDGRGSTEAASRLANQVSENIKEPSGINLQNSSCEQASLPVMDCHATLSGSDDCSQSHWRNVVLENMYQSLSKSKGGIQGCIRDALEFRAQNECTTTVKASLDFNEDGTNYPSQTRWMPSGSQNEAEGQLGVMSNGSLNESSHHTITELCQRAFYNILVSEQFAALCKLLFENFEGIKVDSFFDYSLINTKMEEGDYEHSPVLFSSDIQQVWEKLQRIGSDMVSLAKSLSDLSRTSYPEQVGGSGHDTSEDGKDEFCTRGSYSHSKLEQPDAYGVYKVCTCRRCGEKADGRDCLVCDSCEEMYHVSCIEPVVKEIPPRTWYCASCIASGVELPHENCVVCERLNAPRSLINGIGDEIILTNEETFVHLEESSNCIKEDGLQLLEGSKDSSCKVCGSEVENGEKIRICGYPFCRNKHYHVRCLTSKQLKSYGPRWYCPSCLCRVCLTDQDDDKIVICDGCDHAYHTFCLKPPCTIIPKGKWFCRKCDAEIKEVGKAKKAYERKSKAGIQKVCKAKRVYESLGKKQKKEGEEGRQAYENLEKKQKKNGKELLVKMPIRKRKVVKANEGMVMLLNAADTLNTQEKLAAIQTES